MTDAPKPKRKGLSAEFAGKAREETATAQPKTWDEAIEQLRAELGPATEAYARHLASIISRPRSATRPSRSPIRPRRHRLLQRVPPQRRRGATRV